MDPYTKQEKKNIRKAVVFNLADTNYEQLVENQQGYDEFASVKTQYAEMEVK
jgi:hypothetical protein